MSLKAFHVVFITAASALCCGVGIWALLGYRSPEGSPGDLWMGVGALAVAVGLLVYEGFFIRKLKNVSYL
jgi:hypothetical protein